MSGTFYCRSEFGAPWALALPPMRNCLMLHVVTRGQCILEIDGIDRSHIQPGDLVLVPGFISHLELDWEERATHVFSGASRRSRG